MEGRNPIAGEIRVNKYLVFLLGMDQIFIPNRFRLLRCVSIDFPREEILNRLLYSNNQFKGGKERPISRIARAWGGEEAQLSDEVM